MWELAVGAGTAFLPSPDAVPLSAPGAPLCPTDLWSPSHLLLNPARQPLCLPKSPLCPQERCQTSPGPAGFGIASPVPLLHCLPQAWHLARGRAFLSAERGPSWLWEGTPPVSKNHPALPLPRHCPSPSLCSGYSCLFLCRGINNGPQSPSVSRERGWQKASLSHPQGSSRKGSASPPPLPEVRVQTPHPGSRQQGGVTIRVESQSGGYRSPRASSDLCLTSCVPWAV